MNLNKTFAPNSKKVKQNWHFLDASNKTLGRFATEIAVYLQGKNKAEFTTNTNVGDKVVVTNADKLVFTGRKLDQKTYYYHTGFPGGLKAEKLETLNQRKPEYVLKHAVMGMLPKNKLRSIRINNLYIYKGSNHPHQAQEVK